MSKREPVGEQEESPDAPAPELPARSPYVIPSTSYYSGGTYYTGGTYYGQDASAAEPVVPAVVELPATLDVEPSAAPDVAAEVAPPAGVASAPPAYAAPPVAQPSPPYASPARAAPAGRAAPPPRTTPTRAASHPSHVIFNDRKPRTKVMAIVALSLGAAGVLMTFADEMRGLGWALVVAAAILAIVALSTRRPGVWMSIGALLTPILAGIVSVLVVFGPITAWTADALAARGTQGWSIGAPPPSDAPEAQEIELVEIVALDDHRVLVVLNNPNDDYIYQRVGFEISALDPEGGVLDVASFYAMAPPGETARIVFFGELDSWNGVDTFEVDDLPTADDARYYPAEALGSIEVVSPGIVVREFGYGAEVTVTMRSNFAKTRNWPRVTLVARNAQGEVIDVGARYLDRLRSGRTVSTTFYFNNPLPTGAQFSVSYEAR